MKRENGLVFASYLIWGLLPIFWKQLSMVNSAYVLASRIIWSAIFCGALLLLRHRWSGVKVALADKKEARLIFLCAILISIIATTLIGIPLGVTTLNGVAAVPDFGELGNVMFNLDFKGVFTASGLILVFVCFFGDFFSTLGTVLAVANRANMLDENGNLPGIERPFLVDAIGTCIGALTGNTTITTFVESTSGVEAGGRTGLTALVTGIMFLLTIFLAPLFVAIPYAATGPALIYVGFLMLKGFTEIDFTDFDEAIGPCVMMMFTAFTGNITNGLGAGIIVHVLVKLVRGKAKEIHPIMYLLCALMVLYFIVG